MSERETRKQNAEVIADCLGNIEQELGARTSLRDALALAREVLSEEPRKVTYCELLLEFAPFNTTTERTHCGECHAVAIGWNDSWRFCPLCGSQITQVKRDVNPYDRNIAQRVEFALKEMV